MDKILWCFSIKKGLKKVEPNINLSQSYLKEAEISLSKIKSLLDGNDLVWASVRIYYSAYYSLYSFLQRIGVKSENHDCSIGLTKKLLDMPFINRIDSFKKARIDSQYYLKTGKKEELFNAYKETKEFYLQFRELIKNLSDEDVQRFRSKIQIILKNEKQ